ncbi:MAG: PAS domain S-box protein [Candidatus Saccharibacteria bacterium]
MGKVKLMHEFASLRQKAEDIYHKKRNALMSSEFTALDKDNLLDELEISKIELELQRKLLQQAVERGNTASDKYNMHYDFIPAGFFTMGRDGEICEMNLNSAKLLGNERDRLINRKFGYFLNRDDNTIFEDFLYGIFELHEKSSCEVRINPGNGDALYIHMEGMISEDPDKCFVIAADISAYRKTTESLRDSEIHYRSLFESSKDGILIIDAVNGKVLNLNPGLHYLLGYTQEELLGKELWEIHAFKDAGYSKENFIELQIKGDLRYSEMPIVTKEGKTKSVEFVSTVYVADHTKVIQCNIRDITERKKVEKALKDSEARLLALNAAKDKFFSIIAHDLKGPFNSIIGFSDLLVDRIREEDYEEIEKYAIIIQNSSRRAMDLIMNLMEWSRSQTGRLDFKPENIDMVALIRTIAQLLNDSAQQKSISLFTEMPEKSIVFVDKAMMGTVLRNLISNAIKFTNAGGEIVISLNQIPQKIIVTVSDNGVGIKPEAMNKLFVIEQSYSTIGTNDEKGTGLGLILCKEFIEKHGGTIWAESELGKGSKFHFTIPL